MIFCYCDNNYPVEVVRKVKNKNTYFRIKKDLTVYVTTNILVSDGLVLKMLEENREAISKMIAIQMEKNRNSDGFYFLGKRYDIVFVDGNDILLGSNKVFVGKNVDIDKWYRREATVLFKERLDYCYNNFSDNIPYPKLKIRTMSSRWGVCNYRDNVVTLNLELIKRDLCCLDYVIYHELSHFIEHNHSGSFWKVVALNFPDYKNVRRLLKKY